jgi:hypothetical protein
MPVFYLVRPAYAHIRADVPLQVLGPSPASQLDQNLYVWKLVTQIYNTCGPLGRQDVAQHQMDLGVIEL